MKPLDPDTHARVAMVIDRARRSGVSVPTRLHDARLLWTKEREDKVYKEALQDLLVEFQVWKPHEFLRIVNPDLVGCTPTEMHHAILEWLQRYVEHQEKLR